MTNVFKVFRSNVGSVLRTIGESRGFRPTGDCTPADEAGA